MRAPLRCAFIRKKNLSPDNNGVTMFTKRLILAATVAISTFAAPGWADKGPVRRQAPPTS
ncbi:hypothetical protein CRX72_17510 [Pantoea sp. BRM17]|nr:hypothetical protein CRX72_17510 [Pantoea sp. BRM17]